MDGFLKQMDLMLQIKTKPSHHPRTVFVPLSADLKGMCIPRRVLQRHLGLTRAYVEQIYSFLYYETVEMICDMG